MSIRCWRGSFLLFWIVAFGLVHGVGSTDANLITNGDFETGSLSGWAYFITMPNGDGGASGGFPIVIPFDVNQDSVSSLAAAFRVGKDSVNPPGLFGAGIYQNVMLQEGAVEITADIAALDNVGGGNLQAGFFELILDGIVLDSHNFGAAPAGVTQSSTLSATSIVTAGSHQVRFQIRRSYQQNDETPVQYLDDIAVIQIPEPTILALAGLGLSFIAMRRKR